MGLQIRPSINLPTDLLEALGKAQADATAAMDRANNARQMVISRDPMLAELKAAADTVPLTLTQAEVAHAELQAQITALAARITTLEALKVTVGYGTQPMTGSLLAGASTSVTVTLNRSMGSATYSVGTGLVGGTGLLGNLQVSGVTAQTATTVTVQIKNNGLASLANLSAAVVHVVAAREA